jgi:16S rRNA (cytidine1402-2'-O)-methyltransferase
MVQRALYRLGVLTVVPTPLGNLRDITLRALDALGSARVIACEDTRRTRALLSAHAIPAPELVACDERREAQVADRLVALALAGESVALVSDSGMPLIADPGRLLVARALAAGCPVVVLPGPSAVETALVASGLAAEGYAFAGWVPRAVGERARFLTAALGSPLPSVMFESPRRLAATLADLARLAPEHPVAVARELTKLHEEIVHGSAAEVAARGVTERGEICLVVAAAPRAVRGAPAPEALEAVRELVALGLPARRASEFVARLTGAPRRALYDAAAGAGRAPPPPTLP